MISSDEIFYAVLKDGTVVSNFREAMESMTEEHAIDLVAKALDISYDLFEETKTFPATIGPQTRLLLDKGGDARTVAIQGETRESRGRNDGQIQGRC